MDEEVEAEEIANIVVCLASPLSTATNGAAIRVEGDFINGLAQPQHEGVRDE
jgi:enoyl-[acyl-carrier-protein] reductase (NADH)